MNPCDMKSYVRMISNSGAQETINVRRKLKEFFDDFKSNNYNTREFYMLLYNEPELIKAIFDDVDISKIKMESMCLDIDDFDTQYYDEARQYM